MGNLHWKGKAYKSLKSLTIFYKHLYFTYLELRCCLSRSANFIWHLSLILCHTCSCFIYRCLKINIGFVGLFLCVFFQTSDVFLNLCNVEFTRTFQVVFHQFFIHLQRFHRLAIHFYSIFLLMLICNILILSYEIILYDRSYL